MDNHVSATEDELAIWAIADELVDKGQKPTLAAIRAIRGKGSFTTISEAMKKYRSNKEVKNTLKPKVLPESLKEKADIFLGDIYEIAQTLADEQLQSERDALSKAREEMEFSQAEAAEMADQMEVEISTLNEKLSSVFKELEERSNLLSKKDEELHSLKEETAALKAQSASLEKSIALERQERNKASEEAAELSGLLKAKSAECISIDNKLTESNHKLESVASELSSVKTELKALTTEYSEVQKINTKLESELSNSNKKVVELEKAIAIKETEISSFNNSVNELQIKVSSLTNDREELKSSNVRIGTKLELATEEIDKLNIELQRLKNG